MGSGAFYASLQGGHWMAGCGPLFDALAAVEHEASTRNTIFTEFLWWPGLKMAGLPKLPHAPIVSSLHSDQHDSIFFSLRQTDQAWVTHGTYPIAKIKIENFGARLVELDTRLWEECLDLCRNGHVDGINISPMKHSHVSDLHFLLGLKSLKALRFVGAHECDFAAVHGMHQLEYLWWAPESKQTIDLRGFHSLKVAGIAWHPKIYLPNDVASLERLWIRSYRPRSKDLSEFPDMPRLHTLKLSLGGFRSILGINHMPSLQVLKLVRVRGINDIMPLTRSQVRDFTLDSAPQVRDLSILALCPSLTYVNIASAAPIPTLHFLSKSASIRTFRFFRTKVIDGDMSPLFRLDNAAFYPDCRHYSHTNEEVQHALGITI